MVSKDFPKIHRLLQTWACRILREGSRLLGNFPQKSVLADFDLSDSEGGVEGSGGSPIVIPTAGSAYHSTAMHISCTQLNNSILHSIA